ncbi:hypothetical protein H9L39_11369 [Fusarium oxysporum f. sp. albedinis]|nr:hypothetical protein H9L39_11369 [Fusarium oxysporum f. sp. albedinis]
MTKLLNRYKHYDHVASINTYPFNCSPWPTRLASPKMTPCKSASESINLPFEASQGSSSRRYLGHESLSLSPASTIHLSRSCGICQRHPHLVVRPCPTATDLAAITKRAAHGSAGEVSEAACIHLSKHVDAIQAC